jgi:multiple sugar transport system substrate-binding protein
VTVRLRGLTWDHPRGYVVLEALANALAPAITVRWHRQPLEDFESRPLRTLADDYDLLVIDYPGLGEAVRDRALRPLDDIVGSAELAEWRTAAIGASFASYALAGRQWALPLDAAAQVSACRPDLIEDRPVSWPQACQAARAHRTTLCLGGPHALLMFSAICVAAGAPPATANGEFVAEAAGRAALATMAELLAHADRDLSQRNPIGVLEAMAAPDGPAYCPLIYGYLTYQRRTGRDKREPGDRDLGDRAQPQAGAGRPGARQPAARQPSARHGAAQRGSTPPPHRLATFDAPAGPGGIGSVLGGTGLAVTRSCTGKGATAAAAAQLGLLFSEPVQTRVFAQLGGQSAARVAWHDPAVDRASGGFYSATRRSVQQAWVRPRFAGYPAFQLAASAVLRQGLLAGEPHLALVRRVNELFAQAKEAGT